MSHCEIHHLLYELKRKGTNHDDNVSQDWELFIGIVPIIILSISTYVELEFFFCFLSKCGVT